MGYNGPSIAGLYLQVGLFGISLILFIATFFLRKPGAKMFASFATVGLTYRPAGAVCYWVAITCLLLGNVVMLTNRL